MILSRSLQCFALVAGLVLGTPSSALDLELPQSARLTAERPSALDSFSLPIAAFDGVTVPSRIVEGAISRRSWRIPSPGLTPLQVIVPMRDQIEAQGFELVFECAADACGGFDFRFNTEVLPGPNMYVNISRFRYLSAVRGPRDNPTEALGILVSATAAAAYVQVILAEADVDVDAVLPDRIRAPVDQETPESTIVQDVSNQRLSVALLDYGRVVLDDLDFETGTSDLGARSFNSLRDLATLLQDQPELRIALVGHTDAVGSLESNIALSRARARSVRQRLISEYEIAPGRLDAEGMGYLAPIATNRTDEGRDRNRRVEAILLNVE